jgi:hypothetical protein
VNLKTINSWDDVFFTEFFEFKNEIHQDIVTSFPETLADYTKFFAPESVFAADFLWQAFIVKEGTRTMAQAILCWRADGSFASLGFLDWRNDETAAQLLIKEVLATAREKNLKCIKTPVDMNLFVKYRIRLPGGGKPFFGEPVYPDYYHNLFKMTGFNVIGEWDTFQVNRFAAILDFAGKRKRLFLKKDGGHSKAKDPRLKTTIRSIRINEWEAELKIIYDLFSESYKTMPEFELISFDQFKIIYNDFKYLIQPWLSNILELQGKPVAFNINFVDPLPILLKWKGKELNALQKTWLFVRLRLNNGTYLISHVGKIPGPNGEEIKGVQIQVTKKVFFFSLYMRKVIVSFQKTDSPSLRSWSPAVRRPYARYVLYGMDL